MIPFEQTIAQSLTAAAIDIGAKDTSEKLARAMTAQAVSQVFQTASTGDMVTALSELKALLGAISDPGLATVANSLAGIGNTLLQAEADVLSATPLLGATVKGILADVAAGMQSVAGAYIAKYGSTAK